jgi:hypothetical protein
MQYPIHASWAVSIALKSTLVFLAPSQLFRSWLIFCLVGSLASWYAGFAYPARYSAIWSAKAVLLCVWSAVLVADACERLGAKLNAGRFALCASAALICHSVFYRAPRWEGSHLEAVFSDTALVSAFLGLVMVLTVGKYQSGFWWRYSAILTGYLLFDAMTLYPASEYIERIGIATGIWTSICYFAWILNCIRERLHRKPARLPMYSESPRCSG